MRKRDHKTTRVHHKVHLRLKEVELTIRSQQHESVPTPDLPSPSASSSTTRQSFEDGYSTEHPPAGLVPPHHQLRPLGARRTSRQHDRGRWQLGCIGSTGAYAWVFAPTLRDGREREGEGRWATGAARERSPRTTAREGWCRSASFASMRRSMPALLLASLAGGALGRPRLGTGAPRRARRAKTPCLFVRGSSLTPRFPLRPAALPRPVKQGLHRRQDREQPGYDRGPSRSSGMGDRVRPRDERVSHDGRQDQLVLCWRQRSWEW